MMNEAGHRRWYGCDFSLGYTGYLHALQYAKERPQGRRCLRRTRTARRFLIIEHADASDAAGAEGLRRGRDGAHALLRASR